MRVGLRALWLILLGLGQMIAAPVEVGRSGRQPLAGHLEILESTKASSLEEALQSAAQNRFRPLEGNLSRGYSKGDFVWLRFTLQVPAGPSDEAWLEIKPAYLQELTLYTPLPQGGFDATTAGAWRPFRDRPVAFRNVIFKLGGPAHPLPSRLATCYLRVRTFSTLQVIPILWTPQAFGETLAWEALLFGAFFGVAFLVLLANLIYWVRLREFIHFQYALHLATVILLFASLEGFAAQHLFPASNLSSTFLVPLATAVQPWLFVAIFCSLTEFGGAYPRLDRAYRLIGLGVSGLALLAASSGHYYVTARFLQPMLLSLLLINLGLALLLGLRKRRAAWLYILAFGPFLLGTVIRITWALGIGPHGFLGEYGFHLGAALHFCLMNLPLTERMKRVQRERDQAIRGALESAEIHQRELEGRVMARTHELHEEQQRTSEALRRERRLVAEQKQFLSMVSHEFRTPLAIIDGAAQMARLAVKPPPPNLTTSTGTIRRSAADLLHLVDSWLAQDRIASGLWEPRITAVSLAECLSDLAQRTWETAPDRRITLRVGDLPVGYPCDRELLDTALQNLLSNALKYSPESGAVELVGRREEGWVLLEVIDHGQGIPAGQLEQITNRYFRGSNVGQAPGLGLGLSLVNTIATLLGGCLDLESVEGRGTTARILLPSLES